MCIRDRGRGTRYFQPFWSGAGSAAFTGVRAVPVSYTHLGQPIDGAGPIETTEFRAIESRAPGIIDRQPVKEPLQTGIDVYKRQVQGSPAG